MSTVLQYLSEKNISQPIQEQQNPIDNVKRQLFEEDEEEPKEETESTKKCSVIVTDVRKHPWWGPKVRQLSGEQAVIVPKILKKISPLDTMSKNLHSNVYTSVLNFHLEAQKVCAQLELMQDYSEIMSKIFPWFHLQDPLAHYEGLTIEDDLVKPPNVDHFYAKRTIKGQKNDEDWSSKLRSWKKVKEPFMAKFMSREHAFFLFLFICHNSYFKETLRIFSSLFYRVVQITNALKKWKEPVDFAIVPVTLICAEDYYISAIKSGSMSIAHCGLLKFMKKWTVPYKMLVRPSLELPN